jgi:hypothetical protein
LPLQCSTNASKVDAPVAQILDSDGDFLEFRYDGRRFEPAES